MGDNTIIKRGVVICDNAQLGSDVTIEGDALIEIEGVITDGGTVQSTPHM